MFCRVAEHYFLTSKYKVCIMLFEKNNVDELMSLQEELDNLNLKMIEKFQEWEETEIELKDMKG